MIPFNDIKVKEKFESYPDNIILKLYRLRELIFDVASKEETILNIEETLKWNEPSYITKNGSTLRIDWKKTNPYQYSMYFNCKTTLVRTFEELFSDKFTFVNNREIMFSIDEKIDEKILKYCILLSLTYQDRKHLNMLDKEWVYNNYLEEKQAYTAIDQGFFYCLEKTGNQKKKVQKSASPSRASLW